MPKKPRPEDIEDPVPHDQWPRYQDVRRTTVELYGKLAFGPRWQTPMAEAISKHVGRRITVAQVNNWMLPKQGNQPVRPVPRSIWESLHTLLPILFGDLRKRADELETWWRYGEEARAEEAAEAAAAAKKAEE